MLPALYTLSKLVLNSALWVNAEEHLASCCTTVATYSCTFWPSLRLQWFNRVAMPFLLMLYTMYVHCMYTPYVRCIIWSFQFSHSFVFHCFILFVTFFALFFFILCLLLLSSLEIDEQRGRIEGGNAQKLSDTSFAMGQGISSQYILSLHVSNGLCVKYVFRCANQWRTQTELRRSIRTRAYNTTNRRTYPCTLSSTNRGQIELTKE